MADDTRPLLLRSGHVPGNVGEGQKGDVEGVAEPDEPGSLVGGVHVENAGTVPGVVGDDAYRSTHDPDEGDEHALRPQLVGLENLVVVRHGLDDIPHFISPGGLVGDDGVQLGTLAIGGVRALRHGQGAVAAVGQIGKEGFDLVDAVFVVFRGEVADAAFRGMGDGAPQLVVGHFLPDDRLDDVGTGDVHVAAFLDHEDPVGEGGGIDGPSRRGSHDGRYLGDEARCGCIPVENAAVTVQGRHAFLDPGPAGIVQGDEGLPGIDGHVHDLPDLLGVHFTEAPARAGEVLGGGVHGPPVDLSEAGDDAVGLDFLVTETEKGRPGLDEKLDFLKGSRIEEAIQSFPGGEFSQGVLLFDHLFPAHGGETVSSLFEGLNPVCC